MHMERTLVPKETEEWLWIVVLGSFAAFYSAVGIGGNDAANALTTSVAAGTLSMRTAKKLAALFEFLGAFFLGARVTDVIRTDIIEEDCFEDDPGVLMFGMMCVLISTGTVLFAVTKIYPIPVSTTQATVGAIIGVTLAFEKKDCVKWYSDEFPWIKGITLIVLSWIIAPVACFLISYGMLSVVRRLVLKAQHPFNKALASLPIFVFFTVFLCALLIIRESNTVADAIAVTIALVLGIVFAGVALCSLDTIRHKVECAVADTTADPPGPVSFGAEEFSRKAEEVFKIVQVVAAMADSFAHGANDAANVAGPLAAIYFAYLDGYSDEEPRDFGESDDRWWILAIGGSGIAAGIALLGHCIINQSLGRTYMHHTPARGFCVEFSSAFVVLMGSIAGLPLSTTHCQVGSQTGVALASKNRASNDMPFDGKTLVKIVICFSLTMGVSGLLSTMLFLFGIKSPAA